MVTFFRSKISQYFMLLLWFKKKVNSLNKIQFIKQIKNKINIKLVYAIY